MTNDPDRSGQTIEDWFEYQQNEIDEAKEDIEDRRDHLTDYRGDGLLDGEFANERDNKQIKKYLEGYADALDYAAERVEYIDNLVRYVEEARSVNADNDQTGGDSDAGE